MITPSGFTWAWDTLYVDLNLDSDNPDQAYYRPWVEDWARALNDLRVECSSSEYQLSPDEIGAADGTTFPAEIAADIASFQSAEQIHAEWRASEGSSDTWDQEWADAYLELARILPVLPDMSDRDGGEEVEVLSGVRRERLLLAVRRRPPAVRLGEQRPVSAHPGGDQSGRRPRYRSLGAAALFSERGTPRGR